MNRKKKEEYISIKINQLNFDRKIELAREIYTRSPKSLSDGSAGGTHSIYLETSDLSDEDINYMYDKILEFIKNI